jgi:hypothetical protein
MCTQTTTLVLSAVRRGLCNRKEHLTVPLNDCLYRLSWKIAVGLSIKLTKMKATIKFKDANQLLVK